MTSIARFIDHTRLKPDTTPEAVESLCTEAMRYGFAAICVNSGYVPLATRMLEGSGVAVCSVIGFPLGANLTRVKVAEVRAAAEAGATEFDVVMNIGYFKARDYPRVLEDLSAVVQAAEGRVVKVIIETGLLTAEEKVTATELVIQAGAGFVKTSTGFSGAGATVEDVALLSRIARGRVGVKAAGGIRTLAQARALLAAGASRLGTSAGVALVEEEQAEGREKNKL